MPLLIQDLLCVTFNWLYTFNQFLQQLLEVSLRKGLRFPTSILQCLSNSFRETLCSLLGCTVAAFQDKGYRVAQKRCATRATKILSSSSSTSRTSPPGNLCDLAFERFIQDHLPLCWALLFCLLCAFLEPRNKRKRKQVLKRQGVITRFDSAVSGVWQSWPGRREHISRTRTMELRLCGLTQHKKQAQQEWQACVNE